MYEVFAKENGKLVPVKLIESWTNHDGSKFVAVESLENVQAFQGPNKPGKYRIRFGTVRMNDLMIVRVGKG